MSTTACRFSQIKGKRILNFKQSKFQFSANLTMNSVNFGVELLQFSQKLKTFVRLHGISKISEMISA